LPCSNGITAVNPNMFHLRDSIETNIYKLNQTLDYKLNRNFNNRIQQIRKSSSWNSNQRGLVAHDNRHHYKTIEKHIIEREQEEDRDPLP
jgi:hypothetical protein